MENKTCENCYYFDEDCDGGYCGFCTNIPSVFVGFLSGYVQPGIFPVEWVYAVVSRDSFCGEFKKKRLIK